MNAAGARKQALGKMRDYIDLEFVVDKNRQSELARWFDYRNVFDDAVVSDNPDVFVSRSEYILRCEIREWLVERKIDYRLFYQSPQYNPTIFIRLPEQHAVEFSLWWMG